MVFISHEKRLKLGELPENPPCVGSKEQHSPPLLTLPTSCTGSLATTVEAASWKQEGDFQSFPSSEPLPSLDGCNRLPFGPSIEVTPRRRAGQQPEWVDGRRACPPGRGAEPKVSLRGLKNITVALPEGLQLNAAAADGLQACSPAQVGLSNDNEAACPDASKLGNVTIHSPLLPNTLKGFVYLASPQNFAAPPQENPFESLVAMYVVAKDPVSGVLVKLAGRSR